MCVCACETCVSKEGEVSVVEDASRPESVCHYQTANVVSSQH